MTQIKRIVVELAPWREYGKGLVELRTSVEVQGLEPRHLKEIFREDDLRANFDMIMESATRTLKDHLMTANVHSG
jgi:hypothetical protein